MLTASEIKSGLAGFYGTEGYTRLSPLHGRLVCTDGVAWLAENAECYWLIDVIASYQPKCMRDKMLQQIQFWKLVVNADKSATVTCERDEGDVAIRQDIPMTDFPLPEQKIYVQPGQAGEAIVLVAMLPSEY